MSSDFLDIFVRVREISPLAHSPNTLLGVSTKIRHLPPCPLSCEIKHLCLPVIGQSITVEAKLVETPSGNFYQGVFGCFFVCKCIDLKNIDRRAKMKARHPRSVAPVCTDHSRANTFCRCVIRLALAGWHASTLPAIHHKPNSDLPMLGC